MLVSLLILALSLQKLCVAAKGALHVCRLVLDPQVIFLDGLRSVLLLLPEVVFVVVLVSLDCLRGSLL